MSVKSFGYALAISIGLLGCVTQLTREASHVRAMTELEKPNCKYISDVEGGDWLWDLRTIDAGVDDSFNEALNAVASVGGDAYVIINNSASASVMQAWDCERGISESTDLAVSAIPPQQIYADDRQTCTFIETIAEGSNWGITVKRNLRNAKEDAINLVQEVGGDSYYVVEEILSYSGGIVIVIIEAWRCNFEGTN